MKTVLCYGDSNTWGYNAEDATRFPRNVRWPGVLQQELGDDYHVIEEGLCGRSTVWDDPVEGHKNGLKQLIPILHSHAPLDLLIIMLGTNDLKNRYSVSALDIAWSIMRLVDTARKSSISFADPPGDILVISPAPLLDMTDSPIRDILIGGEEKSRQLAAVLQPICEENDVTMMDAGRFVTTDPVDGAHLNAENQQKLGRAVAPQVRRMLEKP